MTEIKSDTNPDKRKRDKPDNYLDNWIERQSLIESAIPSLERCIGKTFEFFFMALL